MKFYIVKKNGGLNDAMELGDLSFNTFYGEVGLIVLREILNRDDAEILLEDLIIKDEESKNYTIERFLDVLEKANIFATKIGD
jgi:adenine-specific DNA methylase